MIVILGAGLSGSLLAYRLSRMKPRPEFLIIESKNRLGGQHTWSFHEHHLSAGSLNWVRTLVARSWAQQEVRFHDFTRILCQPYHSVTSTRLAEVIQPQIKDHLLLNETVLGVDSAAVHLKNRSIEADAIFDARGLTLNQLEHCGFQNFVGIDLELAQPHGLTHPVIMDANCTQKEGYRFFYMLPWTSHSLLIEDTRYSSSPDISLEEFKTEIRAYCGQSNWSVIRESRVEVGSLPIPLAPFTDPSKSAATIPIGVGGGYFHWTTGYSFSFAVRAAEAISQELQVNPKAKKVDFDKRLETLKTDIKRQSRYFSLLNRMLFRAAVPSERWRIFHRFYHLDEDLIFRFYKGTLKFSDQARILIGRPPVPVHSALKSIFM